MKLKRLFAGILAVAMMATMAAPAFAMGGAQSQPSDSSDTSSSSSGTKSYNDALSESDAKTLSLTKILKVAKGTAPDRMIFNFDVYKVENGIPSTTASTSKSVTFDIGATGRNAQSAFNTANYDTGLNAGEYKESFTLDIPTLLGTDAKVGTYTYKIVEETDYTYQSVKAEWDTVYMTVTKVNDSTSEGTYKYYVALHKGSATGEKIQGTEAFKNVYGGKDSGNKDKDTVNTLTLSKTVHGNLGDLTQTFQFKVKFTKKQDSNITDSDYKGPQVKWTSTDTATAIKKDSNNTGVTNESYLSLDTDYVVTLGHKKSISFENLPDGINYEITELGDNDANGSTTSVGTDGKVTVGGVSYTVTVNGTTNEAGTATDVKGAVKDSMNGADVTKAFHNTNVASIDTGVILDNAPYIALLLIAAAGAVVMVVKKRRHED